MGKKVNDELVKFANEASARRMTYGQLQQLETLQMLKEQEEKKKKEEKRCKETK